MLEVCEDRQEVLHITPILVRLPRAIQAVEDQEHRRLLHRKRGEVADDTLLAGAFESEMDRYRLNELLDVSRAVTLDKVAVDPKHLRDLRAMARGERHRRLSETLRAADGDACGFPDGGEVSEEPDILVAAIEDLRGGGGHRDGADAACGA